MRTLNPYCPYCLSSILIKSVLINLMVIIFSLFIPRIGYPGVPFGFWGLNGYHSQTGLEDVNERFGATVFQVAQGGPSYTVNTFLPMVRAAGWKVTLRLAGAHSEYTTSGSFDLDKWKAQFAEWEDSGIQEFIDDGTLSWHMILDDILNWSWLYGGEDPTGDELEEMARYSQEILPGLPTFVREKATALPVPSRGYFEAVDACLNQYRSWDGDASTYAWTEYSQAMELNLGVMNGLNICDGGNGESGQIGWRADKYAMSANEIVEYGTALLEIPDLELFLCWEYDGEELWADGVTIGSDYFDQTDLRDALNQLSVLAGAATPAPSMIPAPTATPDPVATLPPAPPTPSPTPEPAATLTPPVGPTMTPTPTAGIARPWICDYNGDGTSDIAVFRSSSGLWAIRGISRIYFGATGDSPEPGDYDGDGTTDVGIYRSYTGLWALRGISRVYYGRADTPLPSDYSGDGTTDVGIFRSSSGLWAIRGVTRAYFGESSDDPVPGYYGSRGEASIAIYRPSTGLWAFQGVTRIYFGGATDEPLPGDFDGNGTWRPGIFRSGAGLWALAKVTRTYFGSSADAPLPADYAGTGTDLIGIFRGTSGLWAIKGVTRVYYGATGDLPVTR